MTQLITALADHLVSLKHAIQSANRAQVSAFIQQSRIDLARGLVTEPIAVKSVQDLDTLISSERAWMRIERGRQSWPRKSGSAGIDRRPRHTQRASPRNADRDPVFCFGRQSSIVLEFVLGVFDRRECDPQYPRHFFWRSIMSSALRSFF